MYLKYFQYFKYQQVHQFELKCKTSTMVKSTEVQVQVLNNVYLSVLKYKYQHTWPQACPSLQLTTRIHISHLPTTTLQPTAIAGALIPATSSTSPCHQSRPTQDRAIYKVNLLTSVFYCIRLLSLMQWLTPPNIHSGLSSSKPIASFTMWMEAWTL